MSTRHPRAGVGTALAGDGSSIDFQKMHMGKYFIGWLLGVPAIVLVLLYLVFH